MKPTAFLAITLLFVLPSFGLSAVPEIEIEPTTTNAATENYLLTANDLINVKVFQEDDLMTTCRVAADGTVSMPLIGQVKVAGQTAHEAARQMARLLDARFLVNPQVSVNVVSIARRRFTVLGQVSRPGSYNMQFQDSLDLMEAIGTAGGYTRLANAGKITVRRREGGREVILQINGKDVASGHNSSEFRVQPGDTITVGERLF